MSHASVILAAGVILGSLAAAQAAPLPPERPDLSSLVTQAQVDEGSTTVIKKRGLTGNKTTVIHRNSEPETTGVVVRNRIDTECKNVTVRKEDGMGNSVTKKKTNC